MKLIKICLLLCLCVLVFAGCDKNSNESTGLQGMEFGKNITITVSETETVDAEYLQRVLDGEVKKDAPHFDLWDNGELEKMIAYMKQNDYMIAPGQYTFNQAWDFENGLFVLNSGERLEVFKFQTKEQ